jgi:hypothetical protein
MAEKYWMLIGWRHISMIGWRHVSTKPWSLASSHDWGLQPYICSKLFIGVTITLSDIISTVYT